MTQDRYIGWPLGPGGSLVPIRHVGPAPTLEAVERKRAEMRAWRKAVAA